MMEKLKPNLHILFENEVWSYTTKVAIIHNSYIEELYWWEHTEYDKPSQTTMRHLNYVSKLYNKKVKRYEAN